MGDRFTDEHLHLVEDERLSQTSKSVTLLHAANEWIGKLSVHELADLVTVHDSHSSQGEDEGVRIVIDVQMHDRSTSDSEVSDGMTLSAGATLPYTTTDDSI